ncbi:unnamed protein product [Effrenium voratum]|nr:unnamed protein product [Effrenium voratum]
MAMSRRLSALAILLRAFSEDVDSDYAFSVDASGQPRQMKADPMSLTAILPHWADETLAEGSHAADPDENAEEADDEADSDESSEDSKGEYTFAYRQHVVGSTPTGPLGIGTPSVSLNMILDTGSDKFVAKTWSTIKAELDKIDAGASDEVFPSSKLYNHNSSKSYMQLFISQHGKKVPRQGFIAYGSGMAITLEGRETIRIGDEQQFVTLPKFPISEISLDSLQILHSTKGISGILGLQHMMNRSLGQSFYSVLRDKGVLHSFGYCRGKNNDGTFLWGDKSADGRQVDVEGQMHWAVKLRSMRLTHKHKTALIERFDARDSDEEQESHQKFQLCHPSHCVAVIDTGSNIIAMPSEAVRTLSKVLDVATDCSNMGRLPNLHFSLGDVHISLPPAAYIMKVKLPGLKSAGKKKDANSEVETDDSESTSESTAESSESDPEISKTSSPKDLSLPGRFRRGRPPLQLAETEAEASYLAQVDHLVEETFRQHGLDLRAVVKTDLAQLLRNTSTLCMPAIVPLDRETQKGTLLVVGGPLFEKYYTRWSWPDGQTPKIFVKDLHKTDACEVQKETKPEKSVPKMTVWRNHNEHAEHEHAEHGRMIRTEKGHVKDPKPAELNEMDSEMDSELRPRELNLEEIRYPHWAKYLTDL